MVRIAMIIASEPPIFSLESVGQRCRSPDCSLDRQVSRCRSPERVLQVLEGVAECVLWNQGVFEIGSSTLETLLQAITEYDFAVFVFGPDDSVKIREIEAKTTRTT